MVKSMTYGKNQLNNDNKDRKLIKYDLDFVKTHLFFLDRMKDGNALSKAILNKLNFEFGNFFTLLPEGCAINRVYDFPHGGIMPSSPLGDVKYQLENFPDFQPNQIEGITHEFYTLISDFLKLSSNRYALIENVLGKISDRHIKISGVDILEREEEIYYLLKGNHSLKQIREACNKSEEPWHFVGVIGTHENGVAATIQKEGFDAIISELSFIFVGAYDEEGYVFWEKV